MVGLSEPRHFTLPQDQDPTSTTWSPVDDERAGGNVGQSKHAD